MFKLSQCSRYLKLHVVNAN